MAAGDINGDGALDVITGDGIGANKVYLNDGSGGFAAGTDIESNVTISVALGDLDGDGDLDVVSGNLDRVNKVYLNRAYDTGLGRVTSLKVNGSETNIGRAKLMATDVVNTPAADNTAITYYLSNNGGTQWHRVTPAKWFDFPSSGSDIRWKAELASLSPVISPRIDSVLIVDDVTAAALRNTFSSLDTNGDGMLSLAESGLAALAELEAFDEDEDGQLTLTDLLEITVGPVGLAPTVYVDFAHPGTERGTQAEPFNSVLEAAAFVSSGGTVSIAAGSSGETIIIGKAMTLVRGGASGTAVIGAP